MFKEIIFWIVIFLGKSVNFDDKKYIHRFESKFGDKFLLNRKDTSLFVQIRNSYCLQEEWRIIKTNEEFIRLYTGEYAQK